MTLYALVRSVLDENGGVCTRGQLLNAILHEPEAANRLAKSRGFGPLLTNIKHSGFIEIDGEIVRRTSRRVGRRRS